MGRKLALLIGNSRYDDPGLARLETADVDVREIADVLRAPEIGEFDEVIELPDQGLAVVRRSITQFFRQGKKDDLLVFYFSGHGVKDENGHLYLAVRDTELPLLAGTSIEAAFITAQMDRSYSKRQVLILDCCHSGAFAAGAKAGEAQCVGIGPAFEGSGYGHVVLTATDSTQYAWEGDQVIGESDKSVFTHYLLEGLKTGDADADRDGQITIDELYEYVFEHVVRETPKQTPGKWGYKQQGEIVIAQNLRSMRPVPLSPELQALLDSPLPRLRVEAIPELAGLLQGQHRGLALAAHRALEQLRTDDSRKVSAAAEEALAAALQPAGPIELAAGAATAEARREVEHVLAAASQQLSSPDVPGAPIQARSARRLDASSETPLAVHTSIQRAIEDADREEELAAREAEEHEDRAQKERASVAAQWSASLSLWRSRLLMRVRLVAVVSVAALTMMVYGVWNRETPPVQESAGPAVVVSPPAKEPAAAVAATPPATTAPAVPQPAPPSAAPTPRERPAEPPLAAKAQPKPESGGPPRPTAPPQPDVDPQIQRLLGQGDQFMEARRYDDAIAAYEEAARLGSDAGRARADRTRQEKALQVRQGLARAERLLDTGQYGEALRLIDEALALDPKNAEGRALRQKAVNAQEFERKLR